MTVKISKPEKTPRIIGWRDEIFLRTLITYDQGKTFIQVFDSGRISPATFENSALVQIYQEAGRYKPIYENQVITIKIGGKHSPRRVFNHVE